MNNDADGMTNNVDPDQTTCTPDLGLHCLPRAICPKTYDHYGTLSEQTTSINPSKILFVTEGQLYATLNVFNYEIS